MQCHKISHERCLWINLSTLPLTQGIDASVLGATEFLDYTSEVQSVIDGTTSNLPNSTMDCCNYRHQMLDQFCATREVVSVVIILWKPANWIEFTRIKWSEFSTCCSCRKTWNNNVETLTALDTRFAWSASGNVCKQFWTWSREERNSYVQHLTLAFVPFTASAAAHHEGSDSLPALIHFTSYSQHLDQASTVQQPLRWLSQMKETQVEDWKAIMCMLLRDCWQCLRALVLLCSLNSSKQDLLSPREIHLTASAVVHHPMTLAISSHHCNPFPKFLVISPHQNAPVTISFHQLVCWPGPHVPCLGTALSC